ncbi:hypothetical protein DDB_G0268318 [Dictyostelium discoideum AX4]|uniref:Uncharacterized protein DDB_G0268318 n=1 Tax=Dictyostelium discoideum TaxID=44689 RepID=Y2120_DICDI|nr:hypothetical protein DDB_G0268318 [Dictyostelium discoideum AX4]Q55GE7.1 RecName: Full=Uncharacterized protein DDB_G0268318 [Dictyostelium discoideum]EAL73612.1 hypothetical protein DDB_G0268318 [Dictyostelium discoideum AX4]|eukprot:XP_647237.1 hypothetical protein DDB_G0268318 [Dictyostelium discoideum AX4]
MNEKHQIMQTEKNDGQNITELDFSGYPIEKEIKGFIHYFLILVNKNLSLSREIEMVKKNSLSDLESMKSFYNTNFGKGNSDLMSKVVVYFSNKIAQRSNNVISGYVDLEKEAKELLEKLNKLGIEASVGKTETLDSKKKLEILKNKKEYLQNEVKKSKGFFRSVFLFFFGDNKKNEFSEKICSIEKEMEKINENMKESEMEIFIQKTQNLMNCLTYATHYILDIKSNFHIMKLINHELLNNDFSLCCQDKELMNGIYSKTKDLLTNSNLKSLGQ